MRQRKNFEQERKQFQVKNRWDYFPLGIFSGVSAGVLIWLLLTIPPISIKDFIWPDSYFPLLFVIFFMCSSGFTILFLHIRRALLLSFFLCVLFWLQFQGALEWQSALLVSVPFIVIESVLTFPRGK